MKLRSLAWAAPFLLAAAVPSHAGVGSLDVNPAATLLLPYFEVDLDHARGVDTVFSINNANAHATLAHVTVWSDLSSPVFDFNVYLTGYDVQTIDLRDLFVSGLVPQTASAGQDPTDTISPKGVISQDINFASCNGQLPLPGTLPAVFISHLQNSLTGQPSVILGGRCAGTRHTDRIARGYITVDNVNNCTLRFPTDVGYFGAGGTGDATDDNWLWGDYTYLHRGQGVAVTNNLVHIEADATDARTSTPGGYTFYGRYVGWSAADNREPLPTTFGVRYHNRQTDLIVWRDSKVSNPGPFNCPLPAVGNPPYYPLGEETLVFFDEQEHPSVPSVSPVSPAAPGTLIPFPAEAQRTTVGGASLPVPFTAGWMILDLNTTVTPAGANPPQDPAAAQAWVTALDYQANATFVTGHDAMRFDTASNALHQAPPF